MGSGIEPASAGDHHPQILRAPPACLLQLLGSDALCLASVTNQRDVKSHQVSTIAASVEADTIGSVLADNKDLLVIVTCDICMISNDFAQHLINCELICLQCL